MDQARRLLADPRRRHQTIESVAALVGFTSGAHFSRAFRRQFALSPRQWREQASAANAAAAGAAAGVQAGPSATGW
jgi:AraC-like DNA-binding protein